MRRIENVFARAISLFRHVCDVPEAVFIPESQQGDEEWFTTHGRAYDVKKYYLSDSQFYIILGARTKGPLPRNARDVLVERCTVFLDLAIQDAWARSEYTSLHRRLTKNQQGIPFCVPRGDRWRVDPLGLERLYELAREEVRAATQPGKRFTVVLTLDVDPRTPEGKKTAAELIARLTGRHSRVTAGGASDNTLEEGIRLIVGETKIEKVSDACTEITLHLTEEDAARVHQAFVKGDLEDVVACHVFGHRSREDVTLAGTFVIDPDSATFEQDVESAWRGALRRDEFARPWRLLSAIFSPSVRFSRLAHVVEASAAHCYAAPHKNWRAVAADLRVCWIAWPLFTACLLLAFSALAVVFHVLAPTLSVIAGIAAGLLLGIAGGQVCAMVVSPIGCGAGSIVMGLAFGVVHGIVLSRLAGAEVLSRHAIQSDFFTSVVGGVLGLAAPRLRSGFSLPALAVLLATVAFSIAFSGWLMAQPRRAIARQEPVSRFRSVLGGLVGSSVGAMIGIAFAITTLLRHVGGSEFVSFAMSFTILGGATTATVIWLRFGLTNRSGLLRAAVFGLAHVVVSCALFAAAFNSAGSWEGTLALAAATAWFHATWFTGAFIVADTVGSIGSTLAATTIEGAIGFTAFIVVRVFRA
jgi:hypothetical protein